MADYDKLFEKKWVACYEEAKLQVRIVTESGQLVLEGWEADLSPDLADRLVKAHNDYLALKTKKKGKE